MSYLKWFLLFCLTVPLSLVQGWYVHLVWGWFVVPLGPMPIGVVHGAGLHIFTALFLRSVTEDDKEEPSVERSLRRMFKSLSIGALLTTYAYGFHMLAETSIVFRGAP